MSNQILPQVTYAALLGQVLKKQRETKGIPQQEVAEVLGISQSAYSRMEVGGTAMTVLQFKKVCQKLGTPPADMMNQVEWWIGHLNSQHITVVEEREVPKAALLAGLGLLGSLLILTAAATQS